MASGTISRPATGNIVNVQGNTTKTVNTTTVNPSALLVIGYMTTVLIYWSSNSSNLSRAIIYGENEGNKITVSDRTITFSTDANRQYTVILPSGAYLS